MNVLNDRVDKNAPPPLDPFRALTFALFSGAAISTFLLAPLPLLLAGWRLPEPWSKVVALGGAAIAALVLEAPVPWVAVAFVMSLVFSDQIEREKPVWGALALSIAASLVVALGMLFFQARLHSAEPMAFWKQFIHTLVGELQTSFDSKAGMDWTGLETILFEQAPFLLLSISLVSCWISLGAAAHFGWLNPARSLSSASLREKLRLPVWFSAVASSAFVASLLFPLPHYAVGITRVLSCMLFIQGTLCLSDVLHRRAVPRPARTWVYVLSVVFGFYALLALGVISPWYFRAARKVGLAPDAEKKELK